MSAEQSFDLEYGDKTLVVKPKGQLTSLADNMDQTGLSDFISTIQRAGFENVLVDFSEVRAVGSSVLGALVKISQLVKENSGQMAVCNVDVNDRRILEVFHLNELWKIYDTRAAALDAIGA